MNERGVLDAEIAHIKRTSTVGRKNDALVTRHETTRTNCHDNATTITLQQLLIRLTDYAAEDVVMELTELI